MRAAVFAQAATVLSDSMEHQARGHYEILAWMKQMNELGLQQPLM